ncbi:SCO family protein [Bdellovibrio bacteriovorus]|uniref:SCO family protein n=1 Tax=Bdellovibrio bacteriovorus TaxID=959 RepID=UPI0035A72EF3
MKFIIVVLIFCSWNVLAHEDGHGHHGAENLESADPVPGSSLYQLESTWTDSEGKKVLLKDLKGKPRLVAMLYTRCTTACPLLVEDLKSLISKLPAKKQSVSVTLFSFDSEKETAATMKEFLQKKKVKWQILKGDSSDVAEVAAALGVRYKKLPSGEYVHSNVIYLLDSEGVMIAKKEGLKSNDSIFVKKVESALK